MSLDESLSFVSNTIKTNKSKTATAPAQIMIRRNAKNAHSKIIIMMAVNKTLKIQNDKAKKHAEVKLCLEN